MRSLQLSETETVNGGSAGDAIIFGGIAFAAITIGLIASSPRNYEWVQVPKVTEILTPVHDSHGVYQGDMVDTYTEQVWERRYH